MSDLRPAGDLLGGVVSTLAPAGRHRPGYTSGPQRRQGELTGRQRLQLERAARRHTEFLPVDLACPTGRQRAGPRAILLALVGMVDGAGVVVARQEDIGAAAGCSAKSVRRHLPLLEHNLLVVRQRRMVPDPTRPGRSREGASLYRLGPLLMATIRGVTNGADPARAIRVDTNGGNKGGHRDHPKTETLRSLVVVDGDDP